jgi:hypothetical protein
VTGVAWSACSNYLASCSIDGSICIWDARSNFALLSKLTDIHSPIKGISWTPVIGSLQFIAHCSQKAMIYSCINGIWALEQDVSELLGAESAFSDSLFARPSWSPDGRMFILPNATNGILPIAAIGNSNNPNDHPMVSLIGHLASVDLAQFCPYTLTMDDSVVEPTTGSRNSLLVALASQDGWLSIWTTSREYPCIVLSELFDQSVMDLVWFHDKGADSLAILACSYDGNLAEIALDCQVFGRPSLEARPYSLQASISEVSSQLPSILESRNHVSKPQGRQLNVRRRVAPQLVTPLSGNLPTFANPASTSTRKIELEIKIDDISGSPLFEEIVFPSNVLRLTTQDADILVEIVNQKLQASNVLRKDVFWQENLGGSNIGIVASDMYVAAVKNKHEVIIFSIKTGRRILPSILSSDRLAFAFIDSDSLMLITCKGIFSLLSIAQGVVAGKGVIRIDSDTNSLFKIKAVAFDSRFFRVLLYDGPSLVVDVASSQIYTGEASYRHFALPSAVLTEDILSILDSPCDFKVVEDLVLSAILTKNLELLKSSVADYLALLVRRQKWSQLEELLCDMVSKFDKPIPPDLLVVILEALALGGAMCTRMQKILQ